MSPVADMSDVLALLGTGTYMVTRPLAPTLTQGRVVPGAAQTPFATSGSMQPLSGRDLQRLPEGDRATEQLWYYTKATLLTSDVATGRVADLVNVGGVSYEVQTVEDWSASGNYYRARLSKVNR